ncbi:hypothetical protein H6G33_09615 [Calothrix sp. FACHB-1219]|uniref:hypothetical protein n=1 Tax=unclassified Calothrix TaxID=2619626 RepID=UPI0016837488|nr:MULTISPECIES: hypothetical protein [unclassified Calothrix]MBD2201604.1 hypothetical protein [Calothrix sp. FACHB-168]MBD2217290.1 hypothetical protein [Calothrix sp. FACHB-1219]
MSDVEKYLYLVIVSTAVVFTIKWAEGDERRRSLFREFYFIRLNSRSDERDDRDDDELLDEAERIAKERSKRRANRIDKKASSQENYDVHYHMEREIKDVEVIPLYPGEDDDLVHFINNKHRHVVCFTDDEGNDPEDNEPLPEWMIEMNKEFIESLRTIDFKEESEE